jgi:hypothetical protein
MQRIHSEAIQDGGFIQKNSRNLAVENALESFSLSEAFLDRPVSKKASFRGTKTVKVEGINFIEPKRGLPWKLGTFLQIEIEGLAYRLESTVVGIEPKKNVIIKIPKAPADISLKYVLFPGKKVVVRYGSGGSVFGFKSKVVKTIFSPTGLILLEYPRVIENYDLRSEERVACFFPAKMRTDGGEVLGAIVDISEKGCCCVLKTSWGEDLPTYHKDERITLMCKFPGIEGEKPVSGIVRNIINEKRTEIVLGISLDEVHKEATEIIREYILYATQFSSNGVTI